MKNYYLPLGYRWQGAVDYGHALVVRTAGRSGPLLPEVLATLRQRLPDSEPEAVMAIGDLVNGRLDPWRSGTTLFAMFAVLAVVLATGGLYSMAAYGVAQRSHEFGIRVAVGADGTDLVRLVFATSLRPIALGLLIGLGLALYLVKFLGPLLYETAPRDPLILAAAASVLLVAACVACVIPARTAARTDPRVALQAE
jgi:ABC-type antimicrobial peptide transport system permease subunit